MKYYLRTITTNFETYTAILARTDDGVMLGIPENKDNTDYQNYVAWLAEGNTPDEWIEEQLESDD